MLSALCAMRFARQRRLLAADLRTQFLLAKGAGNAIGVLLQPVGAGQDDVVGAMLDHRSGDSTGREARADFVRLVLRIIAGNADPVERGRRAGLSLLVGVLGV